MKDFTTENLPGLRDYLNGQHLILELVGIPRDHVAHAILDDLAIRAALSALPYAGDKLVRAGHGDAALFVCQLARSAAGNMPPIDHSAPDTKNLS